MLNKNKLKTLKVVSVQIAIFATLLYGVGVVQGFSEPTQSPPNGNVKAPVHIGPEDQHKLGMLQVGDAANSSHSFISAFGTSLSTRNSAGQIVPVLRGRVAGSGDTILYYQDGSSFRVVSELGAASDNLIVSNSGVGTGIVPDPNANLTIGSKGLKLGGHIATSWPGFGGISNQTVLYPPEGNAVQEYQVRCPEGQVMVGMWVKRQHNQGDNYTNQIMCQEITSVIPAPTTPPPPPPCKPDPADPDKCTT